ncbi:MAG TPA: DMT family transporter [Candidatus Saccharimonadales bacterium]|nr:DMT family transporter [Candidatus Saccharimonadales bacterium]
MIFLTFLLIGMLGGTTGSLIKYADLGTSPFLLVSIRLGISVILLLPFVIRSKIKIPKKLLPHTVISSMLLAVNILLFTTGVRYTSALMSQLIYVPTAVVVALLGYFFLKEKLKMNQVFGLIVTFIGISLLIQGSIKTGDLKSFGQPFGNFLILTAMFIWSSYVVLTRKIIKDISILSLTFTNILIAFLISAPFVIFEINQKTIHFPTNYSQQLALLGSAVSSTFFIFLSQNFIKKTSAFIASLVTYVNPIAAGIWGAFLFGEKPTLGLIVGSVIVFSGVFISTSYNYVRNRD